MLPPRIFRKNSIISLFKPHIKELVLGLSAMLIYVSCWPILAWLAGKLIPGIGQGDMKLVIKIISLSLFVFFIQKIAQFIQDIILAKPALKISKSLRSKLFNKLQIIELNSLEKLSAGDITYRLTEDADRVGEVIYKTIQDTTPSLLQLVAVLTYMIYLDLQLSIATLLLAPLITILVSKFGEKVMIAAEKSQEKVSELASLIGEAIQGVSIIKAYAVEEWMQQRFDDQVENHRKARYKTLKLLALQHPVIGFMEAFGILCILTIGASRIQNGALNSEQFSSYFAALLMLIDPISHLTTNFNELQQGQASLKRLNEIDLEKTEKNTDLESKILTDVQGSIVIKNINFGYQRNNLVLNNISLEITKGEKIAIVGPSGAGKSTLFSLLLGFIKPNKGSIYIDNLKIDELDKNSLRKSIGYVPQAMTVFSGTVYEAINFGRNFSKDEVIKAAKLANAHQFINDMQLGYNTYMQERGTNFSGGQLQRISIARALVGNPSILLLDEATSALDADAEKEVQLAMKQAMNSRTVIIIAHRLSTVQEADKIVVMEKGEIIEMGEHKTLINQSGKYSDLCNKQLIKGKKDQN